MLRKVLNPLLPVEAMELLIEAAGQGAVEQRILGEDEPVMGCVSVGTGDLARPNPRKYNRAA